MSKPKRGLSRNAFVWTIGVLAFLGIVSYVVYTQMNKLASRQAIEQAKTHLAKKSYYRAMNEVAIAMYHDKTNPDAYFLWGQVELTKYHNYPQCAYCFSQAIEYSEEPSAALYFLRGKCHYKSRKFKKALADFKQATKSPGKEQIDSLQFYIKRTKGDLDLTTDFN